MAVIPLPPVIGKRLFHDKFGYGKVIEIEDAPRGGVTATIDFEGAGPKRVHGGCVTPPLCERRATSQPETVSTPRKRSRMSRPNGATIASHGFGDGADLGHSPVKEIKVIAGQWHSMATEAEDALIAAKAPFYVRGEMLIRPIVDDVLASHGRSTKVARLKDIDGPVMLDYLSRFSIWARFDVRKNDWVTTNPSKEVASIILSRDGQWTFPRLLGVITTPTMRPDGSILSEPGYDEATRLLLLDPPAMPALDESPTRDAALSALALLDGLLSEFLFVDDASRSVALSALITPVVRGAMPVTPLHVVSAPVAGSGKSYIIDLASAISTGQRAPVIAAGRTEEETEKRLGAALLSGQAIVSIDNVNGPLGGDMLCQMIERPIVKVRVLGLSKLVTIESRATCYATGNNIQMVGDMTRRSLLCSLDPKQERPELREFKGDPVATVLDDRGKYVAACLTIVRAYIAAGCPGQLPALASFEEWSRLVRSALVWLGKPDPLLTMEKVRAEDPALDAIRNLLAAWYASLPSRHVTTSEVRAEAGKVNAASGHYINEQFRDALLEVAKDTLKGGDISTARLGRYLGTHTGRIVNGLKVVGIYDEHRKQKVWSVVKVGAPDS